MKEEKMPSNVRADCWFSFGSLFWVDQQAFLRLADERHIAIISCGTAF